jgi:glutathione S-transferase
MKLYWSNASPYARKVRILIREHGLAAKIEEISTDAFTDPPELLAANPLGKVPTLVLKDGTGLYDSRVICTYLDGLGKKSLVPEDATARLLVLRAVALGDGAMDLAVSMAMERRKPEGETSPTFAARWRGQLMRALDMFATELPKLPGTFSLADAAFASALGYLDFRLASLNWREGRPGLAEWYDLVSRRESLAATLPK